MNDVDTLFEKFQQQTITSWGTTTAEKKTVVSSCSEYTSKLLPRIPSCIG